jgi:predicted RNA polymerase sigma factor
VTSADTHRTIDAVWRIESPRIIAGIARMVRDLGLAEELAQDALVAALEQWPASGIPDNPGAWLTAAAKHRAIDHFRRHKRLEQKHQELKYQQEGQQNVPRISSSSRPPIVEFNRAVAIAMAFGPEAGLALVDPLASEPALQNYRLLPSVRGDLLAKLRRFDEARTQFERALTQNTRERELLLVRAQHALTLSNSRGRSPVHPDPER